MLRKVFAGNLQLAYCVFGNGKTPIIALHGHSKSPKDFESLGSEDLRVLAPSLFHHGDSRFPTRRINRDPLKSEEFKSLIESVIHREKVEKFHLLAYSQGGRFALKILECCPEKVQSMTLLSPDGIDLHGFYDRSAQSKFNQRMMRVFEYQPRLLYNFIRFANVIGATNDKVVQLAKGFTQNKESMKVASRTWRNFRAIRTLPEDAGELIREHHIPFQIIMGEFDGIFPPKIAHRFVEQAGLDKDAVKVIQAGHDFFKEDAFAQVKNLLPFLKQNRASLASD